MTSGSFFIRSIVMYVFEGKGCMQWEVNFDKFPLFDDEQCTDELVIAKALKLINRDVDWWNNHKNLLVMRINTHDFLRNYLEYVAGLKDEIEALEDNYEKGDVLSISDEEFLIYSNSNIKI